MRSIVTFSVATLNIATCWSLQFVYPESSLRIDRFGSQRSQGSTPHENSVVIQSKIYNVSNNNASIAETAQLRRNIYVQKEREENSEENLTEPKLPQYAIDCGNDRACLEAHGMDPPEPTFKPYSQEELEKLLEQYATTNGKPPRISDSASNKLANLYMDEEEAVINVLESNPKSNKDKEESKSSSWHLLQSQKHHQPLDDHKGWVTLEPVPWAQSQIQKWEPNVKPQIPSWDSPSHNRPGHWDSRPSPSDYSTERPSWHKPTYEYKPTRPGWSQWNRPNDLPDRPAGSWANPDIITDNQPGYFPGAHPSQRPWYDQDPYSSNKPPLQVYETRPVYGQQGHPPSHPAEGEGQWVLLSSTKGYSTPHHGNHGNRGQYQRSIKLTAKIPAASVSSHRTVRLTVLPADNSTNTTLSHGGLLEVEQTMQTVEEAQREHAAKMLKLQALKPEDSQVSSSTPKPTSGETVRANNRRSTDQLQVFSASPANPDGKTAVLAAIGAGMIPATMAMLLPMVLGRRRRDAQVLDSQTPRVNLTHHPRVLRLSQRSSATY